MAKKKSENQKPKKAKSAPPPPADCPFAKYSPDRVSRKDIKKAPYNPRVISDAARAKLRENVERVGFLGGIIWNKRTRNLVAGHQRLGVLDTLMRTDNYLVPVDVVDLDEQTEKEQNLFQNNAQAQGDWDMEKLEGMLRGVEIKHTGFNASDLVDTFGDSILGNQQTEQIEEMARALREAQESYTRLASRASEKNDRLFYRVVVFENDDAGEWLSELLDQPKAIFLEGRRLRAKLVGEIHGGQTNPG